MPFNGSGTFSIINTFVPNTTILSAAVNQNFTDIATGLSDCLTRDGQAGMTAVFKAVSGSLGAPGLSFNSDTTAGFYLKSTGVVGFVAKSLGILLDSSLYQVASAAVQTGGSNYAVGDTIVLTGGTFVGNYATLTVATLSGSAVATVNVTYPGWYSVKPADPVTQGATSGSGTGVTFNLTWTTQYTRSVVTDEIGNALPWQRFGASSFVDSLMTKPNAYDYVRSLLTIGTGLTLSNATSPPTIATTVYPTLVANYLSGLTLSTAGGSGTMTIAAGVANNSTNSTIMRLASSISKTTASWAVGSGNGGLDTGAIAANTWYHFFEIERLDTGVVDVLFSLSPSSPTMPTNYTLFRRIGSGRTDGSSHWTAFTQIGDQFIWANTVTDANAVGCNNDSARTLFTLTVPTGVNVTALFRATLIAISSSVTVTFYSPQETDQSVLTSQALLDLTTNYTGITEGSAGAFERLTNTSAQLAWRTRSSGGTFTVGTYGWIDTRGK